jgi:hypothetical protein
MFMHPVDGVPVKTKVEIECDGCNVVFTRSINHVMTSRKKRGEDEDYCNKCSRIRASAKRPQNSKEFWDKCRTTTTYIERYREGIARRPLVAGENNPMWGKTFSPESKMKRSEIWKNRTGKNATGWKGGKQSLVRRVKTVLQSRYKWFHRVIDRDKGCQHCDVVGEQLDAHHIIPISLLIKRLLCDQTFDDDETKFEWLIKQPEIVDNNLQNGIALCRKCHRNVHNNWGSHEPTVRK